MLASPRLTSTEPTSQLRLAAEAGTGGSGRSLGCPAVRPQVARQLIDSIRDGTFVFAYYPDQDWLGRSRLLSGDCG